MAEPDVSQYYHFNTGQRGSQGASYIQETGARSQGEEPSYIPAYARQEAHQAVQTEGAYGNYQYYKAGPGQDIQEVLSPSDEEPGQRVNRFGEDDDIEYADVQFYDDFDDYGIELEFENELRRLTEAVEDERGRDGAQGRGYYGESDLRPQVYVGTSEDYGEDTDFHYASDFDY